MLQAQEGMMESWIEAAIAFLERNQEWAGWIAFVFAFAETTAFLSIIIPSTAILVGVGALVATGAIPFFPLWLGATLGSVLGGQLSYWLGLRFGDLVLKSWPLNRQPDLTDKATAAFAKWGTATIFIGHFVGPLRAVVFVFAGMSRMGFWPFTVLNIVGAAVWAWAIPKSGEYGGELLGWLWQFLPV